MALQNTLRNKKQRNKTTALKKPRSKHCVRTQTAYQKNAAYGRFASCRPAATPPPAFNVERRQRHRI
eukprot:3658106-Pyramimonas_sp.AAC.1